ncbi:MAG: formate/nitrite transporter family protein [Syntrophomonadaceae bacterium]|nr:formate/nitrite transporter family protein [Syntrophomonadaceae bacterium]
MANAAANAGKGKGKLSFANMFVLGIMAGAYIGFGANLATMVGHDIPKFLGNGIGQFLFGAVFSVGLMMVVIGGSELFTGNNMFLTIAALDGRSTWGELLYNWVVVWIANFVGSLLLVYIVVGGFYGTGADGATSIGMFKGAVGAKSLMIANGKLSLTWSAAFCRGILCNWLVCMAVWLALASKDVIGKIFACFFPIMAFVASGFEHSVANMFFIPLGLEVSQIPAIVDVAAKSVLTPDQAALLAAGGTLPPEAVAAITAFKAKVAEIFTWKQFMLNNLVPVTLGNIVGGGIFVGTLYWFTYLRKAPSQAPAADKGVKA